jgi:iron complex transport system ATP-binding protein
MIQIEGVSHQIAGQGVLRDVSVRLPKGGTTALIGPNGAGKSTLLNLIGRQLPLQSGQITLDGLDLSATKGPALALKMALVAQHVGVASRLRVSELIGFGRWPHSRGHMTQADHDAVELALELYDLRALRGRFVDELSGGQRQRAFVAMAHAQDTEWLLLDEPLNNLDMFHARGLMQRLHDISHANVANKSIVIVLHDINFASAWADEIVALKDGKILFQGPPDEVLTSDAIFELYGLRPKIVDIDGTKTILHHA